MIFLTVGSELPFDRLTKATDQWCANRERHDVFGQIADPGVGGYRPVNFPWARFLSPAEYDERCRDADLIIGHAGMGSIITAMTYLKPIVIMPRRGTLRETRNEHQVATAEWLGKRNGVLVADDESALSAVLDEAMEGDVSPGSAVPLGPYAEPRLLTTIREFVVGT
jgi:UDP-N-acetylglucosamine transferase subunit ALG13